jgi:5'-AMP-activated protein kinase regulatory gamma subunit
MQTFGFHQALASPSSLPKSSLADASSSKKKKLTHHEALEHIRTFLRSQSSYDVFPVSFRLIVLDHHLVVKKALTAMLQNGMYTVIFATTGRWLSL